MTREHIPTKTKRAVLVEAGHRCAIPTCRCTTTEIAHIIPYAKTKDNSFENLIALCPNCHTRFDQKKEIDELAMKMYKKNLGIVSNRYGEFERRLFEILAKSKERIVVVGAGGDILLANAIKDGFFLDQKVSGMNLDIKTNTGFQQSFPMSFTYLLTDEGLNFINKYSSGVEI